MTTLILPLIGAFLGNAVGSSQQTTKSLLDVPHVTGQGWIERKKTAIASQVIDGYIGFFSDQWISNTYDLSKKYMRLTAVVGQPDSWHSRSEGQFRITVDGQIILKGSVSNGSTKKVDIDLEDAKSLRIETSNCVTGEPKLYTGTSSASETVRLKSPEDLEKVTGLVEFKWSAIEGAQVYGLEIVCSSLDSEDSEAGRLFAYTVKGKTSFTIDSSKLAPGRYKWTVAGFGDKRMMGTFAPGRSFIVQR